MHAKAAELHLDFVARKDAESIVTTCDCVFITFECMKKHLIPCGSGVQINNGFFIVQESKEPENWISFSSLSKLGIYEESIAENKKLSLQIVCCSFEKFNGEVISVRRLSFGENDSLIKSSGIMQWNETVLLYEGNVLEWNESCWLVVECPKKILLPANSKVKVHISTVDTGVQLNRFLSTKTIESKYQWTESMAELKEILLSCLKNHSSICLLVQGQFGSGRRTCIGRVLRSLGMEFLLVNCYSEFGTEKAFKTNKISSQVSAVVMEDLSYFAHDKNLQLKEENLGEFEKILSLLQEKFQFVIFLCVDEIPLFGKLFDFTFKVKPFCNDKKPQKLQSQCTQIEWENVGGMEEVKEALEKTLTFPRENAHLFTGAHCKRTGILLYGPPGTGKTFVARALASHFEMNFISVKGPELLNMYIGESESNVRKVFQQTLESRPCIVFFDELDSLVPQRAHSHSGSGNVMDRIVSQFITELDEITKIPDIFLIGATNRKDLIDSALVRAGRFEKHLYVGNCRSFEEKSKVFRAILTKQSIPFCLSPQEEQEIISNWPQEISNAQIAALVKTACKNALKQKIEFIESEFHHSKEASFFHFLHFSLPEEALNLQINAENFHF